MHAGELDACDSAPLDRRAVREAAHWLVRLDSVKATEADIQACERWRARNSEHERAWQRAQAVRQALGAIPAPVGMAALQRPGLSRRAVLKGLAGLLVAPPAAWLAARQLPQWTADYRTATGEQRHITLADGTRVLLNTATALDARIGAGERALYLRAGEIYLQSTASMDAPLTLHTPFGQVRTDQAARYSARLHGDYCEIDMAEGEAWLTPAQAPERSLRLPAGQSVRLGRLASTAPQAANPLRLDWTRGILHARDMRLDAFLAELARYRHGILRCDPEVAALRLSGAFQLDNLDGVLRALPALLPVRVRSLTPYYVDLLPAAHT